jgi:hypothetical protein
MKNNYFQIDIQPSRKKQQVEKVQPETISTKSNITELLRKIKKCPTCPETFNTLQTYQEHLKFFQNLENRRFVPKSVFASDRVNPEIICHYIGCHFTTNKLNFFEKHMNNTHNSLLGETIPVYQDPEAANLQASNICSRCIKLYTRERNLQNHLKTCRGLAFYHVDYAVKLFQHKVKS